MKIWIVREAETIPSIMGNQGRLGRAGMFAEYFAERGHKVTWWLSTFRHGSKSLYSDHQVDLDLKKNLHVTMLHVKHCYKKNISLARIRYSKVLARKFRKAAEKAEAPDAIVCGWPLIDLAYECVRYGERHGVPVVVDIRDEWPEIFLQPFKGWWKKVAKLGVELVYGRQTRYALRNATEVISTVQSEQDLAHRWGRVPKEIDHVVHLSYKQRRLTEDEEREAEEFWRGKGIQDSDVLVIYLGLVDKRRVDLDLVLDAARKCDIPNVKFVVCGDGASRIPCQEKSKDLRNIIFPGYINAAQIAWLSNRAQSGLLPYHNYLQDFANGLPNKFGEYLSFGLPVLTCLDGISKTLVNERQSGGWFGTAEELNALIRRYCEDEAFYQRSRANALELFNEGFNAEVVYLNFVHQVEDLVAGGKAGVIK